MDIQNKDWKQCIDKLESISPLRFYVVFYIVWLGGVTFGRYVGVVLFELEVSSDTLIHDILVSFGATIAAFLFRKAPSSKGT